MFSFWSRRLIHVCLINNLSRKADFPYLKQLRELQRNVSSGHFLPLTSIILCRIKTVLRLSWMIEYQNTSIAEDQPNMSEVFWNKISKVPRRPSKIFESLRRLHRGPPKITEAQTRSGKKMGETQSKDFRRLQRYSNISWRYRKDLRVGGSRYEASNDPVLGHRVLHVLSKSSHKNICTGICDGTPSKSLYVHCYYIITTSQSLQPLAANAGLSTCRPWPSATLLKI